MMQHNQEEPVEERDRAVTGNAHCCFVSTAALALEAVLSAEEDVGIVDGTSTVCEAEEVAADVGTVGAADVGGAVGCVPRPVTLFTVKADGVAADVGTVGAADWGGAVGCVPRPVTLVTVTADEVAADVGAVVAGDVGAVPCLPTPVPVVTVTADVVAAVEFAAPWEDDSAAGCESVLFPLAAAASEDEELAFAVAEFPAGGTPSLVSLPASWEDEASDLAAPASCETSVVSEDKV